jgi:chromosome segregation ATPase
MSNALIIIGYIVLVLIIVIQYLIYRSTKDMLHSARMSVRAYCKHIGELNRTIKQNTEDAQALLDAKDSRLTETIRELKAAKATIVQLRENLSDCGQGKTLPLQGEGALEHYQKELNRIKNDLQEARKGRKSLTPSVRKCGSCSPGK